MLRPNRKQRRATIFRGPTHLCADDTHAVAAGSLSHLGECKDEGTARLDARLDTSGARAANRSPARRETR
jgi:hypothetical protein